MVKRHGRERMMGKLLEYVMEKLKKGGQLLPLARVQRTYSVVASRSHLSPETATIIEEKRKEYGEVETVSMGSSLKLCLVAEGSADLYPRFAPTMEWDTAAGHAIARYAGCRVYEPEARKSTRLHYSHSCASSMPYCD